MDNELTLIPKTVDRRQLALKYVRVRSLVYAALLGMAEVLQEGAKGKFTVQIIEDKKLNKILQAYPNYKTHRTMWASGKQLTEGDTLVKQFTEGGVTFCLMMAKENSGLTPKLAIRVELLAPKHAQGFELSVRQEHLKNLVFMVTDNFMSKVRDEAKYWAASRALIEKMLENL